MQKEEARVSWGNNKHIGVYERRGRFEVKLQWNGKRRYIGSFGTEEEANNARIAAEIEACGEQRGNRMLSPKQNAHIAMERFKIQSYNWNKSTAELKEIYGVSDKALAIMRKAVGAVPPKEMLKIKNDKAMALFKCNPEHHKLGYRKVAPLYGVTHTCAQRMIREVCGNRLAKEAAWLDNLICGHPDFGVPGERAPIPHVVLAEELGVKDYAVGERRRSAGIRSYKQTSYMLSDVEKESYKTCALTKSWGRPKGIDALLQDIRDSKLVGEI